MKPVPAWQRRLQAKIQAMRSDFAILCEAKREHPCHHVWARATAICQAQNSDVEESAWKIKMRLMATTQRLRGYVRYQENKLFHENAKLFYRQLDGQANGQLEPPPQQQLDDFWAGILEDGTAHNIGAKWIQEEVKSSGHIITKQWCEFTVEEIKKVIKRSQNWKSPGPDMIHNF